MTAKRLAFCREYARDCNATQAAIRAGFKARHAKSVACRLLKDPLVIGEIHRRSERLTGEADIDTVRVLRELARIAYADMTHVVRVSNGRATIADTDALTPDQRAAIAEIAETENGLRVKMHDKPRALEMLGRVLGLFLDRMEHSGSLRHEHALSDAELERIAAGTVAPAGRPGAAAPAAGPNPPA